MSEAVSQRLEALDPRFPPLGKVFAGHCDLVGRTGAADLAAFLVVTCWFFAAAAIETYGSPTHTYADRALGVQFVALVFAAWWPLAVWRDEPPRRRLHFRSVPVAPITNVLLRVASGLCWLLGAAAVANLIAAVIGMLVGRGGEFVAITPVAWVGYAVGITIVYLIGSAIAVASDHRGPWIAVLVALVYAPPLLLRVPELLQTTVRLAPGGFYRGAFGLDTATRWIVTEAQLEAGLAGFDFGRWLLAAGAWLAISTLLVVVAAYRHPDV
jgi:hypothetical protein